MIIKKPKFKIGQKVYYIRNDEEISIGFFTIERMTIYCKGTKYIFYKTIDCEYCFKEEELFASEEEAKTYREDCMYLPGGDVHGRLYKMEYHPIILKEIQPDAIEYVFPPINTYKANFLKKEYEIFGYEKQKNSEDVGGKFSIFTLEEALDEIKKDNKFSKANVLKKS